MESYFKPKLLLKDELDYELKIRGVVCDRPVNDKRKMLSRLVEKERGSSADVLKLRDDDFDLAKEKTEINATLDSIKNLIADFEGPTTDSVYIRARSRILHLTNRILRIELNTEDGNFAVDQKFKDESYAAVMYLDADLHDKVKEPIAAVPVPSTSTPNNAQIHNTTVFQNTSTPTLSQHYFKSTPVHTLGITFDGDPKQVMCFIERVEEMAHSRHISKVDLFESASDLFSNKAIFWLRHVKSSVNDWDSLVAKLKSDFLDSDADDDTWRQIRERKQSRQEPVILYIAVMQGLFNRLSYSPAVVTKVKYIKRGLQKEYQQRLALQDINSLEELSQFCKRLEEADVLGLCSSSRQILEIDSESFSSNSGNTYKNRHKNNIKNNNYTRNKPFKKNSDDNNHILNKDKNVPSVSLCWKCGGPNHIFKYCNLKIKKMFCFKCGAPDVTSKTCSKCSGNSQ